MARPFSVPRRALQSLRGPDQLVEVGELGVVVPPSAPDRTVLPDQKGRALRHAAHPAEFADDGESREIPYARTFAASSSGLLSRRSSISFVQVEDQSKR